MADTLKNDAYKAVKAPHARPWLAVVGEVPATFAAHLAWGDQPLVAIGMTIASGALTAATWWAGKDTKPARRLHATASTAAATGYLTVAAFTNPLGAAQLSWLAIGGATFAASWNVRKALRVNPESKQQVEETQTGVLEKSLGKAKARLRGEPKVEPNKVTAPYQLAKGEMTNADLGGRINQMASELGISPNSIRIVADPDNASQGEMVFVPKDMLAESAPWPGPSSPGGSIVEPVVVGRYEDGTPEQLWFPFDEKTKRNATHFLVAGMNGSAKSTGMSFAIVDALTRRDCIVWGIDPSKGQQTFGPFLPYMDWTAMTTAEGEAAIDALSNGVITARADALGRAGFKNWTPEAFEKLGMPYMVVLIEEAAKFFREGTEMEGMVMEARSAGITIIISLQRPSATSMPTDVREQLGGVLCFGVKGGTTADMALPEDVRDAGARPEAWENRKPGYNYLVAPGVDEERYAMKARTFDPPTDEEIARALAAAPRTPADPITAAAAGEAYANRTIYQPDTPLTSNDIPEVVMSKEDKKRQEEVLLERQIDRDISARLGDDGTGVDLEGMDPDKEIPAVPAGQVWTFAQPTESRERTPEEAVAELLAMLEEYREQGLEQVGPKHFQPYGREGRIGRSRAWISTKLNDLADEGVHLEETDDAGVYKLLYPAMEAA